MMRQRNVSVDMQTFGCLALGCDQQKEGLQLLKDMEVMEHIIKSLELEFESTTRVIKRQTILLD